MYIIHCSSWKQWKHMPVGEGDKLNSENSLIYIYVYIYIVTGIIIYNNG